MFIVKLGIPVRAASLWRPIQHQPKRIEVRTAARVLSGVSHRRTHFAAAEMTNDSIAPAEDAEARNVGVISVYVGTCVLGGRVRNKRKVRKAALLLVFDETLDRGTGRDDHSR